MNNTPAYNYVNRIRDPDHTTKRQGGGVAIGIVKSLTFRDLTNTVPESLGEALELVFVQIVHEQFELYALNVYMPKYHSQKRKLTQLQKWLLEIRCKKPKAILLVAGDFNTPILPLQHMHEMSFTDSDQNPTFRRPNQGDLRQSRTDWLLCSHNL